MAGPDPRQSVHACHFRRRCLHLHRFAAGMDKLGVPTAQQLASVLDQSKLQGGARGPAGMET